MVGLRWVGCWALLALSCGHTAKSDRHGAPGGGGGTGSVDSTAAGAAGAPLCPVTPASGQWFGRGPDSYAFELASDGSQLSGRGCLGALPLEGDSFGCSPLSVLADKGRSLDLVWDMSKNGVSFGYVAKMELTLSPDRTAMAGTIWKSLGGGPYDEGQDIVLVREPAEQPLPAPTLCSEGAPSGACFLRPLRSDRIEGAQAVELGDGNLLLLWLNRRGIGGRIAGASFDASTSSWQDAEFLDDGTAPIDFFWLSAAPDGSAALVYIQDHAVIASAYDRNSKTWLAPQVLALREETGVGVDPLRLFVHEGGDATLLVSVPGSDSTILSAYDYAAATGTWELRVIDDSANLLYSSWAAASDTAGNAMALMVHGSLDRATRELWFSRRGPDGTWSAPALLYTAEADLISPSLAVGKDGTAVATWLEPSVRIGSSVYSFETQAWSEPLTVTSQPNIENSGVAFDDTGAPIAYFWCNDCMSDDTYEKRTLRNGVWGEPETVAGDDGAWPTYSVTSSTGGVQVKRPKSLAGESALPPLERPRCEGY
jgi:hypothetical protein